MDDDIFLLIEQPCCNILHVVDKDRTSGVCDGIGDNDVPIISPELKVIDRDLWPLLLRIESSKLENWIGIFAI